MGSGWMRCLRMVSRTSGGNVRRWDFGYGSGEWIAVDFFRELSFDALEETIALVDVW